MPDTVPTAVLEAAEEPYPGLRSFRRDETHIFFGREGSTNAMVARLAAHRFLAVTGASGSGKSSLVRTGLLDALDRGLLAQAGANWCVADFRPGAQPMAALATALPAALGLDHGPDEVALVQARLARSPLGLVEWLRDVGLPPRAALLLLVDQFEETFRFHGNDEADAFVALLLASVRQRDLPVYAVITMRSDFLGDCARFPGLAEAINDSQFLAPRLTRPQLRDAIEGPATVFGGTVEPALTNRLLNDAGSNPDQLPLIQHVLMLMWRLATKTERDGGVLTLAGYEALGGLQHALSGHADRVLEKLTARQQELAQALFRALVESEGTLGRDVRRPLTLAQAAHETGATVDELVPVVEDFRAAGRHFLMPAPPRQLRPDTVVDISHESLIRQWARLRDWVKAEYDSAVTYRDVAARARLWTSGNEGRLRNPYLGVVLRWWARQAPNTAWADRYGGGFDLVRSFIASSRTMRGLRRGAGVAAVVLLLAGSIGFGVVQYRAAETARQAAAAARQAAVKAEEDRRQQQSQRERMELQQFQSVLNQTAGAPSAAALSGKRDGAADPSRDESKPSPAAQGSGLLTELDQTGLAATMAASPRPLLIDVWPETGPGHAQSLTLSLRMPFAGDPDDETGPARVARRLDNLTGGNKPLPLVFFCAPDSCDAAAVAGARAAAAGYTHLYWFRGGMVDWRASGTAVIGIQQQADRLAEHLDGPRGTEAERWAYAAMLAEAATAIADAKAGMARSLAAARKAVAVLEDVRPAFETDPDFLADLAFAQLQVAIALQNMDDVDGTVAYAQRAVAARQAAARLRPADQAIAISESNANLMLGRYQLHHGRAADGIATLRTAADGLAAAASRVGSDMAYARAVVDRALIDAYADAGRFPEALAAAKEAEGFDAGLAARRPGNEGYEVNLWTDRAQAGWISEKLGNLDDAVANDRAAAARLDEVAAAYPAILAFHVKRADGHLRAARVLRHQNKLAESLAEFRAALAAARAAWAGDATDDGRHAAAQAFTEIVNSIGDLSYELTLSGDAASGLAAADLAFAQMPVLTWIEMHRAHALMFLGRVDEAREIYLRNQGRDDFNGVKWNDEVREDFAELRKAGRAVPQMAEIEAALPPSRK